MPHYLIQARYTAEAMQRLIGNPTDRGEAIAKLLEAGGGKLHAFYYSSGDYDIVFIAEVPDHVSGAAAAMTALAGGAISHQRTTLLLTREEGVEAMRKAGGFSASYTRPGS